MELYNVSCRDVHDKECAKAKQAETSPLFSFMMIVRILDSSYSLYERLIEGFDQLLHLVNSFGGIIL